MFLGADIGGTKTNLALFEFSKGTFSLTHSKKYPSQEHASLTEITSDYLKEQNVSLKGAVFGIAGPVLNEEVKTTNLPWDVKADELKKITQCPVHLINDLEANAWGLRALKPDELVLLNPQSQSSAGNKALISAGTGLGIAGLYFDGKNHLPFASEGGHSDFAPTDAEELKLYTHLTQKFGHVSYERVVSGQGLVNLYDFFTEGDPNKRDSKDEKEKAKWISQSALEGDPASEKALSSFCNLYGSVCGNVALLLKATDGIYLGGGIAPKILPYLQKSDFLKRFQNKGRFSDFLSKIPVWVVTNDKTALLGSGYCAHHLFSESK